MPHVVVAGAGPAGAALSFLLARRGARVTLIERQTDFAREFRGEVLMLSGIDAFPLGRRYGSVRAVAAIFFLYMAGAGLSPLVPGPNRGRGDNESLTLGAPGH
jgi:NADPH-dependent 2,4-dienoyl-CoA reductase/sulfur reductase-like enzyme